MQQSLEYLIVKYAPDVGRVFGGHCEGVASHSLRFWHAFVGSLGALNDINILNRSPLFSAFINGQNA